MLPARARLRKSTDFATTVRGRHTVRRGSRLVVVHLAGNAVRSGESARVGFVVSKAVGGAVVRNRTKRILRAVMASRLGDLPHGIDVVVRANHAAAGASSDSLAADIDRLLPSLARTLAQRSRAPK